MLFFAEILIMVYKSLAFHCIGDFNVQGFPVFRDGVFFWIDRAVKIQNFITDILIGIFVISIFKRQNGVYQNNVDKFFRQKFFAFNGRNFTEIKPVIPIITGFYITENGFNFINFFHQNKFRKQILVQIIQRC